MKISESLKRCREHFNLTQAQVAESIGILQQTYYKYEAGKNVPSADVVVKLANAYGVSTDYLLGLSDEPASSTSTNADNELVNAVVSLHRALQNVIEKRGVGL